MLHCKTQPHKKNLKKVRINRKQAKIYYNYEAVLNPVDIVKYYLF